MTSIQAPSKTTINIFYNPYFKEDVDFFVQEKRYLLLLTLKSDVKN